MIWQTDVYKRQGWRVSWCVGHLAGLADADSYDPKYAKWRYDDLPILPEHWQMVVGKDKKKQFDILKKLMNAPDVTLKLPDCLYRFFIDVQICLYRCLIFITDPVGFGIPVLPLPVQSVQLGFAPFLFTFNPVASAYIFPGFVVS